MEKMTAEMGSGGGGGGHPVSSRWNPTKEQISILENLYRQGVRTPSADQIQQITVRLKDYGHIEGKNVFYWFQNHKARQRQKQKQQQQQQPQHHHHHHHFNSSFPFFNHFLQFNHNNSPFPPPPPNNVVCSPYYVHQNDVGLYPQYQNNSMVIQSGGIVKKRSKSERRNCIININEESSINNNNLSDQTTETLSLFPTHPTGDLQASPQSPLPPPPTMVTASASDGISDDDSAGGRQPYFEFFM